MVPTKRHSGLVNVRNNYGIPVYYLYSITSFFVIFNLDEFSIQLKGGLTASAGNVEVQYDDTWSNVCYDSRESETRQWSFYNAQVVCRELGFPGTMIARKGGFANATRKSIVDGYKCREGKVHFPRGHGVEGLGQRRWLRIMFIIRMWRVSVPSTFNFVLME